jgi:6-phosphogluconolactonase (cycloisomerase 2 family)
VDQATAALSEVAGSPSATAIGTHRLWPDPQGRFLYVSNAAKRPDGPECVSGYRVDAATGALTEIEGSPFKTEAFVNQMDFHPSGRFVYATAGHFLLAYQIAPSGALEPLPVPDEPVFEAAGTYVFSLVTSRDGRFLFAFQQSGWILSYRIDQDTGGLTFVGELRGTVGYVAWLLHPAGTLAFTLSASPPAIHVHRIDATRGLLTEVTSPAALEAGTTPETRGQRLWLDASGQALGVLVRRPPPSEEVLLCTYRAELTAGTLAPVACTRVGETGSPLVAVVNQAPAWRP